MARKKRRKSAGKKLMTSPGRESLYTIADDRAVQMLVKKLGRVKGGSNEMQEKLREALAQAARKYEGSSRKERQAFLHGLLTGYGVGLKLKSQ